MDNDDERMVNVGRFTPWFRHKIDSAHTVLSLAGHTAAEQASHQTECGDSPGSERGQ